MITSRVRVDLQPMGISIESEPGTALRDLLFPYGVEFPCGGHGRCKGCRIRVLQGALPISSEDERVFTTQELQAGWRLACRAAPTSHLTLELAQWEAAILADHRAFSFSPRPGCGVAVDLGTTTIVAQLLDLRSGNVLGVRSALNPQARHGADIMSRIEFAMGEQGAVLTQLVREQIGRMIVELIESAGTGELNEIILVGNTVMHHLFGGLPVDGLAHDPFNPATVALQLFSAPDLGWPLPGKPRVWFLPCLGGFVGSDILAGILAAGLHEADRPAVLVDLGTNGEIVVGNRHRLLCASTAAGPAFEGAKIMMGMRAVTGAIAGVERVEGGYACRVLGNVAARGICGSGLVDAVAAGLDSREILGSGKLASPEGLTLQGSVRLVQRDIRELQLAKGAIAAGIRILADRWGVSLEELDRVYLAGAFGNYVRRSSARRIGLLPFPAEKIEPSGNTALMGAKMALFSTIPAGLEFLDLRRRVEHVSLNLDPVFREIYVQEMVFAE